MGFDASLIARLLPMSLQLGPDGRILRAGPTLRRVIGGSRHFDDVFAIDRPRDLAQGHAELIPHLDGRTRLLLRLRAFPATVLRGHGVLSESGSALLNLGFGVGLVSAVRDFGLTDADFSPSELTMELLFLHEANAAVQRELALFSGQLESARRRAERQASIDPLTGSANRRGLELALRQADRKAAGQPFAVMTLDLDYFKQVNDRWGHGAGDKVLQHVALVLRQETRACDTVARLGGDEFVLVLPLTGCGTDLLRLARRIIARIGQPIRVGDGLARVSASIGIAESQYYKRPDPMRMLADADAALYAAKANGRGRAMIHGQPEEELPLAQPVPLEDAPAHPLRRLAE